MSYVFWQNMPNHLQSPWIAALAVKHNAPVWMIVESDIPESRRKLGWTMPDYSPAILEIGVTPEKGLEIIEAAGSEATHIFSGIGAYPALNQAFRQCLRRGLRVGLLVESKTAPGIMGFARKLVWRARSIRFGRRLDFILGIGEGTPLWYFRRRGFNPRKIFEFGYFTPLPLASEPSDESVWAAEGARLLYIGLLARAKGIDQLLHTLAACGESKGSWQLRLVGTGPDEAEFKSMVETLGLTKQVVFCGAKANSDAMAVLRAADVLILPSRGDGWGAVINEALLRGVPVICSEQCGARQVVAANPALGAVYRSVAGLRSALDLWISKGRRTASGSAIVRELAQGIEPVPAADYFLAIMKHTYNDAERPRAPWLPRSDARPA